MNLSRIHMIPMITGLFTCLLIQGCCTIHHGTFSVTSDRMVQLNNFESQVNCCTRDVTGNDVTRFILGIPTDKLPTIDDAIEDALMKGNGDFMKNVTFDTWWWTILIYGEIGWTVKGDVLDSTKKCSP